ncbi:MAG: type II toxin-antitoxin system VapC family toxin [Acidobacteria bacterium]|nr:type II toxin-antitoxin system VapC family toxin [Acidobacteriota bacterium]
MIVLDTNVLSEPLKTTPAQSVIDWLDSQSAETLYITAISRAELLFGVLRLPEGKRKKALAAQVERVLGLFNGRTLDFNSAAADKLAQIVAECEKNGKRAMAPDAYIAACAAANGFAVATRNVNHFEHLGVRVIDPWR